MEIKDKIRRNIKQTINNTFWTRKLFEQYKIRKISGSNELEDIAIYANSFCNAKCNFCDVPKVDGDNLLAQGIARPLLNTPNYMSTELFEKIVSDDFVTNGKPKFINFIMTEPLLSKNLKDMLKLAKQRGHTTKVTTNGYLLTKRAEEIVPWIDRLQISIDALKDLHDSIRGDGFFERAISGLKEVRRLSNLRIEINVTISPINYHSIYDLLEYLDGLDVALDEVRFQFMDFISTEMAGDHNFKIPAIIQGESVSGENLGFSNIDYDELYNQLVKIKSYNPKNIKQITMKPNLNSRVELEKYFDLSGDELERNNICSTPFNQVAINTAGKVYWHMRCFNDYVLGDINENGLSSIFNGEEALLFRNKFIENDLCFPACTRCCGLMTSDDITKTL